MFHSFSDLKSFRDKNVDRFEPLTKRHKQHSGSACSILLKSSELLNNIKHMSQNLKPEFYVNNNSHTPSLIHIQGVSRNMIVGK